MVRGYALPRYLQKGSDEQRDTDKIERRVAGKVWVYVIHWQQRGPTKVGVAFDPRVRRSQLQGGNPYKLEIFTAFGFGVADLAFGIESATLARLKGVRMNGEWLDATPIQVRDAVAECAKARKIDPAIWGNWTKPVADPRRARKAMDEYRRLNYLD